MHELSIADINADMIFGPPGFKEYQVALFQTPTGNPLSGIGLVAGMTWDITAINITQGNLDKRGTIDATFIGTTPAIGRALPV